MRLITLNIWGGNRFKEISKFISENKEKTDIFLFQEVFKSDRSVITPNGARSNILGDLIPKLREFKYLFSPTYHGRDFKYVVDYPLSSGQCVFWKKSIKPNKIDVVFTHLSENVIKPFPHSDEPDRPVNFQYLKFDNLLIINLHGYWNPAPKSDVPERIIQSEKIISFINKYKLPTIVGGDFNLRMDTESIKMLEESGLRNLVRESGAKTTRTNLYDIKWRKNDKFADYIFSSKRINIYDFKVMPDVVSDHSPLLVKFDV